MHSLCSPSKPADFSKHNDPHKTVLFSRKKETRDLHTQKNCVCKIEIILHKEQSLEKPIFDQSNTDL